MKNNRDPEDDAALTPGQHEQLWQIVVKLPTDLEPWGQRERDVVGDCSCSCRWFLPLVAMPLDWGVCANPASPRAGLLTFEHQGCPQFEQEMNALVMWPTVYLQPMNDPAPVSVARGLKIHATSGGEYD